MQQKTALILGASGLTGRHCLNILLNSSYYSKVIVLVRRRLDIADPRVEQAVIDFDYTANMEKYYDGVDDVFSCIGTNLKNAGSPAALRRIEFHIPTEAANIASEHGVKRFLAISTKGADNHSSDLYLRVKGEMEKGLEQFSFTSLHIFRPSEVSYEDNIVVNRDRIMSRFFNSGSRGNTNRNSIGAETLAKAMVNTAQQDKDGNFYYSTGQIKEISEVKYSVAQAMDSQLAEM